MVEVVRADLAGDFRYAWGLTGWGDGGRGREPRWGILIVGLRQGDESFHAGLVHVLHPLVKIDLFEDSSGSSTT
jgi:hypothetical protein